MFRLKEALGALSPPLGITSSSSSSTHHGNPGQQVALQNRISILTQQLQVKVTLEMFEEGKLWQRCRLSVLHESTASFTLKQIVKSKCDNEIFILQDWERKHKQVVAIYRSHLLAAVQVSEMLTYTPEHKARVVFLLLGIFIQVFLCVFLRSCIQHFLSVPRVPLKANNISD